MKSMCRVALSIVILTIGAAVITAQQRGAAPRRGVHVAATRACPCPYIYDYMPQVADVAKAKRFYNEVLQLEPEVDATQGQSTQPFLKDMYAIQGQIRNFISHVPQAEFEVEGIQWNEAQGKPLNPQIQDAGAARLVLSVNNVDAFADRLKAAGVRAITAGGKPVAVPSSAGGMDRVFVVEDGNGFFVELVQHPVGRPRTAEQDPQVYIYAGDAIVTVGNIEEAARFYREVLELDVWVDPEFHANPARLDALGLKGAQYREARIGWPGGGLPELHLVEFRGVERKTLTPLVHDPDALLLRTTIADMDTTLAKVKAFPGAQIMNVGGTAFPRYFPPNRTPYGLYGGITRWLIVRVPSSPATYMQLVGPGPRDDTGFVSFSGPSDSAR